MRSLPLLEWEPVLGLSLEPWLRRLPAALIEPLGGTSLPAVDTLAEGPGSLIMFDRFKVVTSGHKATHSNTLGCGSD